MLAIAAAGVLPLLDATHCKFCRTRLDESAVVKPVAISALDQRSEGARSLAPHGLIFPAGILAAPGTTIVLKWRGVPGQGTIRSAWASRSAAQRASAGISQLPTRRGLFADGNVSEGPDDELTNQ